MEHSGALVAQKERKAIETVRIRAAGGKMEVDLARHVAIAYQQINGGKTSESLRAIREMFDAEGNRPADQPCGRVL